MAVLISTYWNVNMGWTPILDNLYYVLISTYWNVNTLYFLLIRFLQQSFNLNLLECKFKSYADLSAIRGEF